MTSPMVWGLRASVAAAAVYTVRIGVAVARDWRAVLSTDPASSPAEKVSRQMMRGTVASLALAGLFSVLMGVMVAAGAPESLVVLNFGFVFANVAGYVLDKLFTTDEGLAASKQGRFREEIGSAMFSWDFVRFLATVMFDMMVSAAVVGGLTTVLSSGSPSVVEQLRLSPYRVDRLLGENMGTVLSSVAGVLTFNAYGQQSRLGWAFTDPSYPEDARVPGGAMLLALAAAAASYLGSSPPDEVRTRTAYTLGTLAIMTVLGTMGRETKRPDESEGLPPWSNDAGWGLLALLAFYGVGSPLLARGKPAR